MSEEAHIGHPSEILPILERAAASRLMLEAGCFDRRGEVLISLGVLNVRRRIDEAAEAEHDGGACNAGLRDRNACYRSGELQRVIAALQTVLEDF